MIPISVVIPTLNEEKYIESLLKSLKPQLKKGDEIIIVDSHSSDKTVKIARKYTKTIFFMPRLGIGPAKTYGARRAKNEIVAFLDADSLVAKGWLDGIKRAFAQGADIFCGIAVFTSDYRTSGWAYWFSLILGKASLPLCRLLHKITRIIWAPPNSCAYRKPIFLKAGGYRQIVCEDWDLAARMKNMKSVKCFYDDSSAVLVSDRRFRKKGIIKTWAEWMHEAMKILTKKGAATDSRSYERVM